MIKANLSYNPFIKDKGVKYNYINKFFNVELSDEELYNYLTEDGYAISVADLKGKSNFKKRKSENFISSRVIVIEINNNNLSKYISYDSILNNNFIRKYASFIFTSHKHTEECNKFKIVFILGKPIHSKNEYSILVNKLTSKFNIDTKATSPVQLIFGNNDCARKDFIGNMLPLSVLNKIDIKGKYTDDGDINKEDIHDTVDFDTVILYTDGSYSMKNNTGGYGFLVLYNDFKYKESGGYKNSTTQRMELIAVKKGLDYIYKNIYHKLNKNINIIIYTDSKYVNTTVNTTIHNLNKHKPSNGNTSNTRIPSYKKKSIYEIKRMMETGKLKNTSSDKRNIKNLDLIESLKSHTDILKFKSVWIRSRNGNKYNNMCDELAKGAHEGKSKCDLVEDVKITRKYHHL